MIPRSKLTELQEASKKASRGPWKTFEWEDGSSREGSCNVGSDADQVAVAVDVVRTDAEFIAAANPTTIIQLLDAIETLSGALEELRLSHEHMDGLRHIRKLGDTYGWCDHCQEKISFGPGIAEEALARVFGEEK